MTPAQRRSKAVFDFAMSAYLPLVWFLGGYYTGSCATEPMPGAHFVGLFAVLTGVMHLIFRWHMRTTYGPPRGSR